MHASYPSEHKGFCLNSLDLQDSEKLEIHMLKFVVSDLIDTLKNGGVVLGFGVDFGLDGEVSFSLVHIALNVDDFLEDREDIAFDMFDGVKK